MTADFETQLTALLDDVAGSITPRADFGAVREAAAAGAAGLAGGASGIAGLAVTGGRAPRPFRRGAAAAAAAVLVVAGGAAAMEYVQDDSGAVATTPELTEPDDLWSPADEIDEPAEPGDPDDGSEDAISIADADDDQDETGHDEGDEADDEPGAETGHTVKLGLSKLDHEPPMQWFHGRAPAGEIVTVSSEFGVVVTESGESGEWRAVAEFDGAEPGTEIAVTVSFAGLDEPTVFGLVIPAAPVDDPAKDDDADEPTKDEEPVADEPPKDESDDPVEDEPASVAFTAVLGWAEPQPWGMKVGLWGSATPGSVVELGSEHGSGRAEANDKGEWQMIAELEMAPGAKVVVVVEASSSDRAFEFLVERPAEEPAAHRFTAALGTSYLDHEPPEQWFFGTGRPGSAVVATSPYGSADAEVRENGEYELKLVLSGAPAGAVVPVQVSNTGSDKTHSFELKIPAEEPAAVEFTAHAVYESCDEIVPYNEYYGTAMPGSVVLISSPYGSVEKVAGGDGGWEALVEFPSAPRNSSFVVQVKSLATGQIKEFTMTVGPLPGEGESGDKGDE